MSLRISTPCSSGPISARSRKTASLHGDMDRGASRLFLLSRFSLCGAKRCGSFPRSCLSLETKTWDQVFPTTLLSWERGLRHLRLSPCTSQLLLEAKRRSAQGFATLAVQNDQGKTPITRVGKNIHLPQLSEKAHFAQACGLPYHAGCSSRPIPTNVKTRGMPHVFQVRTLAAEPAAGCAGFAERLRPFQTSCS